MASSVETFTRRARGSERERERSGSKPFKHERGCASPRVVFKQINREPSRSLPVAGETSYTMCLILVEIREDENWM